MVTYIPPTGTIQMLAGVHLNPKQEDTLWYDTTASRDAAFDSFVYATYTEQSYSRPTRNSVKIQDTADRLYKCSYMRFKNGAAFGGQWIYCFVLAVEYVNNNTCEVFYQIDDMITWFPQCELRQCFVEREIPATDRLFENLIPENLETGEYTINGNIPVNLGEPCYLLACAKDRDGDITFTYLEDSHLSIPLKYYAFYLNSPYNPEQPENNIVALLQQYYKDNNSPENIISINAIPSILLSTDGSTDIPYDYGIDIVTGKLSVGLKMPSNPLNFEWFVDVTPALDNYIPKNKKLHTFPYKYIQLSNNSGQIVNYNYEDFVFEQGTSEPTRIYFQIMGTPYGLPCMLMIPKNYKTVEIDEDEGCVLSNFPSIPWVTDTYKAYLAQNRASITTSLLCSAVSTLASSAISFGGGQALQALGNAMQFERPGSLMGQYNTISGTQQMAGSVINGGVSIGAQIAQTIAKLHDAKQQPNTVHGLSQCDAFSVMCDILKYEIMPYSIKAEQAKLIDDYFSAYGYAQHKIKIPNTHSRPFWNYTKTQGCIVVGDVPADALARISAIFDRGIRFWKHNSNIGDYSLNNSV